MKRFGRAYILYIAMKSRAKDLSGDCYLRLTLLKTCDSHKESKMKEMALFRNETLKIFAWFLICERLSHSLQANYFLCKQELLYL